MEIINNDFVIVIYDRNGIEIEKWMKKINSFCKKNFPNSIKKFICCSPKKNLIAVKSCEILPNISEEYLQLINKTKSIQGNKCITFIGNLNEISCFIKDNKELLKFKKGVILIDKNGSYLSISSNDLFNRLKV